MMRITVDRLLEPFSFSQFCDAYYEKWPLLVRREAPAYYDGLLTLDTLDAHLGQGSLVPTELQLFRKGERIDEEVADTETVFARFHEGCTIGIGSLERHNAAVLHLLHDMERVFHAPVATCAYLTPRSVGGFHSHQGREDTIILQFAGTMDWTVRDRSRKPAITAALAPGDLLYLPNGFAAKARSADAVSGHMTFLLQKFTYADLLRQIADNAHASPWLRRSLPADFRSGRLNAKFLREVHQFFDNADLPAYLERMHSDFAEDRLPDSANRLADYVKLPSISAASRFRKRSGVWPELAGGSEQVVLTLNRKSLEFPAAAAESIRFMIDAGEFAVSALPGNDDENLALCSTLVREGFLTIV